MNASVRRGVICLVRASILCAMALVAPLTLGCWPDSSSSDTGADASLTANASYVLGLDTWVTSILTTDLDNPRGLSIAPSGELYVADSGLVDEAFSGRLMRFESGSTIDYSSFRFGAATRQLTNETFKFGLSDVFAASDGIFVAMGAEAWLEDPLQSDNRVVLVRDDGTLIDVFDVGQLERELDPDGNVVDSNAAGVAVTDSGAVWVSDAAGNWVGRLTRNTSEDAYSATTIVSFPDVNGQDAVPTGIVIDESEIAYVTLFNCNSDSPGKGGVARVQPDGQYSIAVGGLNAPIDIAIDDSNTFYILEFALDYAPNTGRVIAYHPDGTTHVVIEGLNYPTSLAVDVDGAIYVAEIASPAGGERGSGRLVAYEPSS